MRNFLSLLLENVPHSLIQIFKGHFGTHRPGFKKAEERIEKENLNLNFRFTTLA